MVLYYAEGGNFNNWINSNRNNGWNSDIRNLKFIINGLKIIHGKMMVHRDFHMGNILLGHDKNRVFPFISDMGLCGEVGNVDTTKIYGVMPYVAPEVLRGK